MKSSTTNLAILFTLITSALSDDSTPIATFKSDFSSSALVPEIIPAFNPSIAFYAGFNSNSGSKALLTPGISLSVPEAKAPFELSVENVSNASARFIVFMVGPDVPSRSKPTSRNVRHFLAANLSMSASNSQTLSTANLLLNSSAATNEYAAPAPAANTGSHRYMYLIYEQPAALNTKSIASLGFNVSNRIGFNISSFHTLAGLGAPIGGTFFEINTDTNSTSNSTSTSISSSSGSGSGTSTSSGVQSTNSSGAVKLGSRMSNVLALFGVMGAGALLVGLL